jgi:ATP-dependent Lon protease
MAKDGSKKKTRIVKGEDRRVIVRPATSEQIPENALQRITIPDEIAILPVRNMVIFPGTIIPLSIIRGKSRKLFDEILPEEKIIATICQKSPEIEDPAPDDLYTVGTAAIVLKLLRMEEGGQNVIVHGLARVRILEWTQREPYLRAKVEVLHDEILDQKQNEALLFNAKNLASRAIELSPNIPDEAVLVLNNITDAAALADFLASNLQLEVQESQKLLEESDINKRLARITHEIQRQLEILELSSKIQDQVKANIDHSQREYFLQEQLKAIQEELGLGDEKGAEIAGLKEKIIAAKMPEKVQVEALRDLSRLERIPTASPEYSVTRSYLDVLTELPWSVSSDDRLDVALARNVLDEDHYDLEKVKRRILEYLAVRKLAPNSRGPILCFVGPPGVGKTSLGQSIARALGRKFIRMSLGGMRDEAELRGHRRTYIGAMPGRVMQELRKAETNNPVFMLDELDKVGADFRGDPTSALLELLDPAQNNTFQDHYLNVPFDLSKVLFIATANYMAPVPAPLRDRMEIIEIPGYTDVEKLHIAQKYLVQRQRKENGLKASQIQWPASALRHVIRDYTREAGVRELERQIGTVCRGVAAMIVEGNAKSRTVTPELLEELLGPVRYENELALRTAQPGVVTGLAYTPVGGEILFIEATAYPGKGQLILTGQIGDVMKESVTAALSLVKNMGDELGIDTKALSDQDIHVHVPAGAIPKDGPSAGAAMFTTLVSLLTNTSARPEVAMTGEITLRGLVLPIGGVKEKVLAAKQAGIKTVILPARNEKDLVDIPAATRQKMEFHFVKNVREVLKIALRKQKSGK